jgi:hypothetical protein
MEKHTTMKIMEDEVPAIINPGTPEGIRNPGIQVPIRRRGRVIGDCRRAIAVIIIVDDLRAWTRGVVTFRGLGGVVGRPRGKLLGNHFPPDRFGSSPVFLGDGFIPVGKMNNSVFIGIFIYDRIPGFTLVDGLRSRGLNLGVGSHVQPQLDLKALHRL